MLVRSQQLTTLFTRADSLTTQRSHNTTKMRKWIRKTIAGTHAEDWILYMVELLHWLGNGCHKVLSVDDKTASFTQARNLVGESHGL